MATQWYYRSSDGEEGPVAFLQLAELLNEGVLNNESLVKEDKTPKWRRVDEVDGLVAQARRLREPPKAPVSSPSLPSGTRTKSKRRIEDEPPSAPPSTSWWAYVGVVLMAAFIGFEVWWVWPRTPERFPESKPVTLQFDTPSRIKQMAPRSRKDPKRPLEPQGLPVRVPGLEGILWAKNPTLTPDLLTIVYVTWGGEETRDDLFIAERAISSAPFSPPVKIANCAGPKREMFPSLSSDGLRLLYSEDTAPSRLMVATRTERGKPFEAPQQLIIEKLPADMPQIDNPQWLTLEEVSFTASSGDNQHRGHFLARRTAGGNTYVVAGPFGLANPWHRYVFTPNRRRAYFLNADGLGLTMQSPRIPQFTTPELWLTNEQLGPDLPKGDDAPWVSPSEDVIVFCSQGHEKPDSRDRHLWILRLE